MMKREMRSILKMQQKMVMLYMMRMEIFYSYEILTEDDGSSEGDVEYDEYGNVIDSENTVDPGKSMRARALQDPAQVLLL